MFEPRFDKQKSEIGICDLCILQPRARSVLGGLLIRSHEDPPPLLRSGLENTIWYHRCKRSIVLTPCATLADASTDGTPCAMPTMRDIVTAQSAPRPLLPFRPSHLPSPAHPGLLPLRIRGRRGCRLHPLRRFLCLLPHAPGR